MTETKPATDEEIAQFLAAMEGDEPESEDAIIRALIARIDKEEERAEKAERVYVSAVNGRRDFRAAHRKAREERDALAAQLAEARQQIAALREALRPALALVETLWIDEEERARAALAQTEEPRP